MTISVVRTKLRKGKTGKFRKLNAGELIEPADVLVSDSWYDFPAEQHIGQKCEEKDTILRLEFE